MVYHSFWTGETGRELREAGRHCQIAAVYLVTCRMASSMGIFYLPESLMAHESGLELHEVNAVWPVFAEAEFAFYDHDASEVWVPSMPKFHLPEELKPRDHRHTWLVEELRGVSRSRFLPEFLRLYGKAFHLEGWTPPESPSKGLSKGPRSPFEAKSRNRSKNTEASLPLLDLGEQTGREQESGVQGREESPPGRPVKGSARARQIFEVFLQERAACFEILGRRASAPPKLDTARARRIDEFCEKYGEEVVRAAPLGLRHSAWHMGKKDGEVRLSFESVFNVTARINQLEVLAELYHRAEAGERVTPIRRPGRAPAGAADSLRDDAAALERKMGLGG